MLFPYGARHRSARLYATKGRTHITGQYQQRKVISYIYSCRLKKLVRYFSLRGITFHCN